MYIYMCIYMLSVYIYVCDLQAMIALQNPIGMYKSYFYTLPPLSFVHHTPLPCCSLHLCAASLFKHHAPQRCPILDRCTPCLDPVS